METEDNTEDVSQRRDGPNWLLRLVRLVAFRCGYALVPISRIERIEKEARMSYASMRHGSNADERSRGYFNGLADAFSKTAHDLREKSLPNVK